MNKNTLIGTVLMCLIFMAMVWTSQPSAEQLEAQRRAQDSIARLQTEAIENSMNILWILHLCIEVLDFLLCHSFVEVVGTGGDDICTIGLVHLD